MDFVTPLMAFISYITPFWPSSPAIGAMAVMDCMFVQAFGRNTYTDQELVTLLRRGIKRDGLSMIEMPTNSFSSMADADLIDIIAWLRSLKPDAETETAQHHLGLALRFALLAGNVRISARCILDPSPPVSAPTSQLEQGEYLAKVSCTGIRRPPRLR